MKGTDSPDCKHKHMLQNGAPPDKFGVLNSLLHTEFHDFNSRINVLLWFLILINFCTDGMGPFNFPLFMIEIN